MGKRTAERRCKSCNDSYEGQNFWTCTICGGESCGNCSKAAKSHDHIDCDFTDADRKWNPGDAAAKRGKQ